MSISSSSPASASSAAGATPSVVLGTVVAAANVNLSTEGTIDWIDSNGSSALTPWAANNMTHRKINGTDIMSRSLCFFGGGNSGITMLANNDAPFNKTTTAADDIATAALSAVTTYSAVFTATGSALNYGFRFDVPCVTTPRTLNLYCGVFSGTITVEFTLADGTTISTTVASAQKKIPVVFNGRDNSDILRVKARLTTNGGSSPNVQFYCATLTT
jgi:hypothetical protein